MVSGAMYWGINDGGTANSAGSFDNISIRKFLPLSTVFTFENQKIGHFCSLSAGKYFSPSEIALFDISPESLTAWALGEIVPGIDLVKDVDSAYYAVTEA